MESRLDRSMRLNRRNGGRSRRSAGAAATFAGTFAFSFADSFTTSFGCNDCTYSDICFGSKYDLRVGFGVYEANGSTTVKPAVWVAKRKIFFKLKHNRECMQNMNR